MRVVHLARKPLTGSVASNVLEHGTGALNIDATRLGYQNEADAEQAKPSSPGRPGLFGFGGAWSGENPSGRWPANLVLEHLEGCRRAGSVQVRKGGGTGRASSDMPHKDGFLTGKGQGGFSTSHYGPDGTETVAAWSCGQGCPVAALDEQSGPLHSQDPATRKGRPGKHGTGGGTTYLAVKETGSHYNDTGGASRFFKQVKR
jgi:hypothetical protein